MAKITIVNNDMIKDRFNFCVMSDCFSLSPDNLGRPMSRD